MHEMAITQSVVDAVCEHAAGRRVHSVKLEVGALCAIVPAAMEFCFGLAAEGTVADGARLDVDVRPGAAPPPTTRSLMRNCDARMTGEVHKGFHEQRRNWSVLPKPRSVIAAVAVCVAMYLGTAPALLAAPQQNISSSNSDRVSRTPVITAKPERVTLSDGSGSTEIDWNTGNGSLGFVFVNEDGGKPVLFATGSRGNQVVPWIGKT